MLVAASDKECEALFKVGDSEQAVYVPLWKGFYGQWGWRGHSEAFLKDATIAHIGTHRHQGDEGNLPYDLHVYGFSRYSRRCADGDAARKQERGGIRHDGFGQRHRRRASGERHFHPSGCEVTSFLSGIIRRSGPAVKPGRSFCVRTAL